VAGAGRAQPPAIRVTGLQREINDWHKAVESWDRANTVIFFGKGGGIATNRSDEQELSVLCLRIPTGKITLVRAGDTTLPGERAGCSA
jgi:TnpA family transposase